MFLKSWAGDPQRSPGEAVGRRVAPKRARPWAWDMSDTLKRTGEFTFTAQTSICRKPDWTVPFKQTQVETLDRALLEYDKEKQVYQPRLGARRPLGLEPVYPQ